VSTKIYDGYRLAEGTDVWAFTEKLRDTGNARRDELDMHAVMECARGIETKRVEDGEEPETRERSRLMRGFQAWSELMHSLKDSRLGDPYQLDAVFLRDPANGRVLVMLYAGAKMESVFTGQPEVEGYGFWDNTDPEEGASDEDWQARGEAWDRAVGMDPPASRGLTFQLRCSATDGIIEMIYEMERR